MNPKEQIRFAKFCCSLICGKNINSTTWTNWKLTVGIRPGGYQQSLTDTQFNQLCAIAYIRMQDQISGIRTRIDDDAVYQSLEPARRYLKTKLAPHMRLKLEESEQPKQLVTGAEIPDYLAKYGFKRVSLSTLRRKIHGFSINKAYTADEILRIAS